MSLQAILQSLAMDTSVRLRDSQSLEVRFGEETITDLVLLELKRLSTPNIRIIQTSKPDEAHTGTDWDWWIGSDRVGWTRYAIQAKKMNPANGRYGSITQRTGSIMQIDVLDKYAKRNGAIALYCFYNSVPSQSNSAWNCCKPYDEPQLACTVSPSFVVRPCITKRGTKNFDWIHSHVESVPWRCLNCTNAKKRFRQTKASSVSVDSNSDTEDSPELRSAFYEQLPDSIRDAKEAGTLIGFPDDVYDHNLQSYPRRVVVLESTVE